MFPHTLDTLSPWCNTNSLLFPEGQPIRLDETPNPRCRWKMISQRKKEGSENKFQRKIRKGQVYVPKLEPTAPICLEHRNHAHYLSRHRTIKKKTAQ